MIDPPFITAACLEGYAATVRLLLAPGGKVLLSTVRENAALLAGLLGLKPLAFLPSLPHLVYQARARAVLAHAARHQRATRRADKNGCVRHSLCSSPSSPTTSPRCSARRTQSCRATSDNGCDGPRLVAGAGCCVGAFCACVENSMHTFVGLCASRIAAHAEARPCRGEAAASGSCEAVTLARALEGGCAEGHLYRQSPHARAHNQL